MYTDDFEDSMMQVGMSLQFDSIEDVDELGAQLVLSIHMTVVWRDNFIYWNASDTPGCHYLYVPEKWLWKPDITLVNAAKDFEESMMPTDIFVTSELTALRASENVSGNAFQARPGIISSICKMDFTDFPFDTQHCTLTFSSNMYGSWPGGIALSFIENATYGFNGPGTLVRDTFESTSWKVVSVTSYSTLELRPYFGYTTMLHWEVTLSRFTSYYYATAIAPNLAITTIALLALWISDLGSRLGLTITAMLTVVAVLVSVT